MESRPQNSLRTVDHTFLRVLVYVRVRAHVYVLCSGLFVGLVLLISLIAVF